MTLPVATSFKKSSNVCIGLELWAGFVNKNKCMYLCRKIYSSDVCLFACFLRNSNKLTKKKKLTTKWKCSQNPLGCSLFHSSSKIKKQWDTICHFEMR